MAAEPFDVGAGPVDVGGALRSAPAGDDGNVSWAALEAVLGLILDRAGVFNASMIARWVLEEASGLSGAEWLTGRCEGSTVGGIDRAERMTVRLMDGEPVQYVIGHWPFRSLDLMVDRRVLIPRPETESIVDLVIAELAALRQVGNTAANRPQRVVDLGTGSGAIGLSVLVECPHTEVILADRSEQALAVASANLVGIGRAGTRGVISHGHWFGALADRDRGTLDIVVSNPPYVAIDDAIDDVVKAWEPHDALFADDAGRSDLSVIAAQTPDWLSERGALIVELDPGQARWMIEAVAPWATSSEIVKDLAGRDRFVIARR